MPHRDVEKASIEAITPVQALKGSYEPSRIGNPGTLWVHPSYLFSVFFLTTQKMLVAFSLLHQPLSFFPFTILKPVAFTSLTPSLAWLVSVVVLPSSSLVCGSSQETTLSEARVSLIFDNSICALV